MPAIPVPVNTFWTVINVAIIFLLYLPVLLVIFWIAENRGESGCFWAFLCFVLPGLGPIIFLTWCLITYIRSRKPQARFVRGLGAPETELSRQRLYGGGKLVGKTYDEIEKLISDREWDKAEEKVRSIIQEAEKSVDGGTIADMIGYLERIKEGKKGKD